MSLPNMQGDHDQIVPIADSTLLSTMRMKHGAIKVYRGLLDGRCTLIQRS